MKEYFAKYKLPAILGAIAALLLFGLIALFFANYSFYTDLPDDEYEGLQFIPILTTLGVVAAVGAVIGMALKCISLFFDKIINCVVTKLQRSKP